MIIAHISDTHLDAEGPAGDRRYENFARTMAHIRALRPQPDVIVHTGDVSHNATPEEYAQALELLADAPCPFVPVVGNRDRRGTFIDAFRPTGIVREQNGFVQYAVDLHGLRIVGVDTLDVTRGFGDICDQRLNGVDALLRAAPDVPTLVLVHHAPTAMPGITHPVQYHDPSHAEALAAVIARQTGVVATLSGHIHRAEVVCGNRSATASKVMTVPSIATDLRQDTYPSALEDCPVYQIHQLSTDGIISRSCVVYR